MSTNKNAYITYKVLDNCFRNPGKKYFIEDLIDECDKVLLEIDSDSNGISRRQIFDDIKFMESNEGWNIELDRQKVGKRVYYRYKDTNFSINNMPLNKIEINQLIDTINTLSQFQGMPQFEWINELLPKLKQGLSVNQDKNPIIIEFDSNKYLKGIEYLGILYNAIFYNKTLRIEYKPFDFDEPEEIIFHPYYLKQYNNRWFLFGFKKKINKPDWNLALDRIISISELNEVFIKSNINWNEYFEDIYGVTKPIDREQEEIILEFNGATAKYMETKPIHGSQKSKWISKDTLEVKLNLYVNYELEHLILSYAESVIVKKPDHLAIKISERLERAYLQYKKKIHK